MMDCEKYSVLMSVYNKENPLFLQRSVESMLAQTKLADEIVIVKDGPLNSELDEVIDNFKKADPEVFTIIQLEKNLGLGLALNEGLKIARNNLIVRMDSDDISIADRCEIQLKQFANHEDLVIVGSHIDEFEDDPDNIFSRRIVPLDNKDIVKFSKRRSPFNHPTVVFRKDKVLEIGGYRNVMRKEDIDLFIRMIKSKHYAMNIDQSLLLFRSNKDNFKRRKTFENCISYIKVILNSYKIGHSSLLDLIYVSISQMIILVSPVWLLKYISNEVLRSKVVRGSK